MNYCNAMSHERRYNERNEADRKKVAEEDGDWQRLADHLGAVPNRLLLDATKSKFVKNEE